MVGKLISISGLDGAGKSTQINSLIKRFEEKDISCYYQEFTVSDYSENARKIIDRMNEGDFVFTRLTIDWKEAYPLIREFVYNEELQTKELALCVSLVFAGGSNQVYSSIIRPLLDKGVNVISDRFWLDDVIYRSYWLDEEFLTSLYRYIPFPNLAIFLETSPETIFKRNKDRPDGKSKLMRSLESIKLINDKFIDFAQANSMMIINGNRHADDITSEIVDYINRVIRRGNE